MKIVFETSSRSMANDFQQTILQGLLLKFGVSEASVSPRTIYVKSPLNVDNPLELATTKPTQNEDGDSIDLFIDDKLIGMFLTHQKYAAHVLHHELCHCLDFENIKRVFGKVPFQELDLQTISPINYIINRGYKYWGEYYATRVSHSTFCQQNAYEQILEDAKNIDVKLSVLSMELTNAAPRKKRLNLFYIISEDVNSFFYKVSCMFGDSHGSNNDLFRGKITSLANYKISPSMDFEGWMADLEKTFTDTYSKYPDSLTLDDIIQIGRHILRIYEDYSIFLFGTDANLLDFNVGKS